MTDPSLKSLLTETAGYPREVSKAAFYDKRVPDTSRGYPKVL